MGVFGYGSAFRTGVDNIAKATTTVYGKAVGAGATASAHLKSNQPLNRAFEGVKNAGIQTKQAYRGEVPMTTAFRKGDAIADMRNSGQGQDYQWGDKSLSWKKIGAAAAGGYVGIDSVHRMGSGGGVTRNAEGQRDIVGIPII